MGKETDKSSHLSWDELKAKIEIEKKTLLYKFKVVFIYPVCRLFSFITEIPSLINHVHQRIAKGYSKRDLWNFNSYISEVLENWVKDLIEVKKAIHVMSKKRIRRYYIISECIKRLRDDTNYMNCVSKEDFKEHDIQQKFYKELALKLLAVEIDGMWV